MRVEQQDVEDRVWDFGTRDSFRGFIRATFIDWVGRVPEDERIPFIDQAIDRYRPLAGDDRSFRFYQMEVRLAR